MPPLRSILKYPGTYLALIGIAGVLFAAATFRPPTEQWTVGAYGFAVRAYQARLRPFLKGRVRCRFLPSCSEYSRQAVERHGLRLGLSLTIQRLRACRADVTVGTVDEVP